MKNILILATLLSFLSCQKNLNRYQEEKHFDPKELSNLSLDTIDTFWGIDSAVTISNYFNHYPECIRFIKWRGRFMIYHILISQLPDQKIFTLMIR